MGHKRYRGAIRHDKRDRSRAKTLEWRVIGQLTKGISPETIAEAENISLFYVNLLKEMMESDEI